MNNARRRILVTGGAGFIGSHLCGRLLETGHEVLCVDNLFTGARENIAHLLAESRFEFMRHDVTQPLYAEVDEIYNFACPASPERYQSDPIHTIKTSVCGAINVLGLAKRVNAKIMQASTSEVYGTPQIHPQHEAYWGHVNPVGSRSCYDEGKRCAETLFTDYRRRHGVITKLVRIFNTYGPRMRPDDGRVVSNFVVQALLGRPLTVYGDGTQTRSFCYVSDLVEGVVRLMDAGDEFGAPVNLGNPHECTVLELAQLVIDLTGTKSRITFARLPQDDPTRRCPDIETARALLKWEPRVPLRQGLEKTIAYFDARLHGKARAAVAQPPRLFPAGFT